MPVLDDYQIEAINKLKNGSILCGAVGSGKSRTAVAYYIKRCGLSYEKAVSRKECQKLKPLYIITTAQKRDKKEWEIDLSPFFSVSVNELPIIIDSWNNIKKYRDIRDSFLILDEQRLVGSGVWVKSFLKMAEANEWILLSATPGDTWSDYIPVFIANGFYKNRTAFLSEHAVWNRYTKYPSIVKYIGQGKLIKERSEILVKMDYKTKARKHVERLPVAYDKELYKEVNKSRWNIDKNVPVQNISELCYLLRKITNSHENRKEIVLDLCRVYPKVIIFYNHDYELEILRSIDYPIGTIVAEWNGHKHEALPTSKRWVYLVQYAAGSEGWNCTSTNVIIFYSLNYSYRTTMQAMGRIDRRNTPFQDLYYYILRSNSPIDLGIAQALSRKKNFNEGQFFSSPH